MVSMRTAGAGRVSCWLAMLATLFLMAAGLSACSGGSLSGMFSGSGNSAGNNLPPVAFADIVIGPPKPIGDQFTQQLVTAAQQKNIPVVTDKSRSVYTVQGYLAQSNERSAEKFSYILDVSDKSGKRVHRILGEEAVPAKPGAKPWSSINQAAMQKIATATANDLAAWLPTQGSGGGNRSAVAAAPPRSTSPPARSSSAPRKPKKTSASSTDTTSTPATSSPPPAASSASSASSSSRKRIAVLIPPVSGAPGDGRTALANALRDRLSARGVQIATTGGTDVYRINGEVTIGPAPGGNQRVRIVWKLTDPKGGHVGNVTQNADVPKGSLDRRWGKTAQEAGGAAAAEMMKLIKQI